MKDSDKSKKQISSEVEKLRERISHLEQENSNLSIKNERLTSFYEGLLSQTALEFLELPLDYDLYQLIGEKIKMLVEDGFVVISTYDPDSDRFKVNNIAGKSDKIKKLTQKFLKIDFHDLSVPLHSLSEKRKDSLSNNQFYHVVGGLYEITGNQFSKKACLQLENELNIISIYAVGFQWEDSLYGSAIIFLTNESDLKDITALKTLVNLASVALKHKTAEEALQESEEKFRNLFNNANDAIFLHKLTEDGISGKFIEINNVAREILGYSHEELLQMAPKDIEDYKSSNNMSNLLNKDNITFETVLISKEGHKIPVEISTHIFTLNDDKLSLSIARDITERKKMENELQVSLEEKEMLLKEIHHRVKNNLMIISSLLNLQSRYIKDKRVLDVFKDSQNRARSMALIHDKLYQSSRLKSIDIGDYIRTLASDLFRTYTTNSSQIDLNFDIEEVMMDINTMIPLGLIVNELLSNCLKHAFPEGRKGEITIGFHHSDHKYLLSVRDDGIGFPEDLNYKKTESLGLRLVNILTDQIDGEIVLKRDNGTEFRIEFEESQYANVP